MSGFCVGRESDSTLTETLMEETIGAARGGEVGIAGLMGSREWGGCLPSSFQSLPLMSLL